MLIKLHRKKDQELWVNASRIMSMEIQPKKIKTSVYMDDGAEITVIETPAEIAHLIANVELAKRVCKDLAEDGTKKAPGKNTDNPYRQPINIPVNPTPPPFPPYWWNIPMAGPGDKGRYETPQVWCYAKWEAK